MAGTVPANADAYAAKLADPNIDVKLKLQSANELRDSIDLFTHTVPASYTKFLQKLMPVFLEILRGPPVFVSTSSDQKLRGMMLDILHRLPFNPPEALEPWAVEVMQLLMELVRIENEENAVLCMKTIMDFQRNYQRQLADQVQPFLNLIMDMFKQMPKAVKDTFDSASTTGATLAMPGTPGNSQAFQSPKPMSPLIVGGDPVPDSQAPAKTLTKGMQSFKVLAECPIIVVSLFQAHRNSVNKNVRLFVPLIKEMLQLQAGPQKEAHEQAKKRGESFTGVSPAIKNRVAFGEFITAQVKTMSFLAYVLRVYAQQLTEFLPHLPEIVVRLLKDCPRERSGARKELLVATRHIINFNFRRIFLKKIDELLDERVLIGDGLTVYETMRPLAYSMLADLIHHVREQLNADQIRRTVDVYTKNLHDNFPGTSFQTMSAKLLLNLAEFIAKLDDKQEARHFLIMILDAIAEKFAAMNRQFPNAVKQSRIHKKCREEGRMDEDVTDEGKDDYDEIDIFTATPIKTSNPRERGSDPVADNKFLFKNLMNGLKNMLFSLRTCNPPSPPLENMPSNWSEVAFGFSAEEVNIIIKLFREGARVFRYYRDIDKDDEETVGPHFMVPSSKEEKDLLETFATVFHCIDPATFHEVFHSEIPYLYGIMFDHSALLHVPQFFLASEATSPSFCGMLLQFLMNNIEDVGSSDQKKAQILLRLFKLSFMAVTLFSGQNEIVLLPHVRNIVLRSINLATTAEEPMNYFYLLRSLFRGIAGGRFDHLYKELLPLLEVLLENLNTHLNSARKPQERDLFVELCLAVPARLSHLLPHLSYLMKPLVVALRGGQELVGKGLKTLELCVDNLTAEYLDPIMAPYIDDLMAALWEHLRPLPYNHFHSHTTMRILGKLGGRNRKFLTHPPETEFKTYPDDVSSVNVKLIGAPGERPFPLLTTIDLAFSRITEVRLFKSDNEKNTDLFYKQQSLRYLSSTLKLFIGHDQLPDDFVQMVRLYANDLYESNPDSDNTVIAISDRRKSVHKKRDQEAVLRKMIRALIHATAVEQLADEASALASDVCRHFTLLELGRAVIEMRQWKQQFVLDGGEGPMHLDNRALADAIGDCLGSDIKVVRETAKKCIRVAFDTAVILFGSNQKVHKLYFFTYLARIFCHNCFEEEWYPKFGGVTGIRSLIEDIDMGNEWLKDRQNDIARALLYVIKDMPQDLPAITRKSAQEVLTLVLRRCNQGVPEEDFSKHGTRSFTLCALLVYEISNPNKHVRETVQAAFDTLEKIVGVSKTKLMYPVKERLLTPIFNKPLRALPFASQIGYIDAITYCLRLEDSFLEFNEEMNRLMMEALALADADDEQLSSSRPMEYRTTESVLNLRVVCIKLLSTAILSPDLNTPEKVHSRSRIISVFFKSLYYKSPEVIDAANTGLKGVLNQTSKLPRDLLQSGLRPILMNLSDTKRLNVAGLEGLARLLELLTNYFKVEIGSRLLEHLKNLADVKTLQQASHKLLEQNSNIKIIAAILNVFHLLPSAAVTFMSGLFGVVIDLEEKLRRTQHSPVRSPLLKFINRYPAETWKHILPRMVDMRHGRLFAQLLRDESSKPLRDVVQGNMDDLLAHSLNLEMEGKSDADKQIAVVNAISIVRSIASFVDKEWMEKNGELMKQLLHAAVELRRKSKESLVPVTIKLAVEQALASVMEVFMMYLTEVESDLDFLFDVIDMTTSDRRARITNILTHYIYTQIICEGSIELWRNILNKCLNLYVTSSSQANKTFAFRYLVNPILLMDKRRGSSAVNGQRLVDKALVENVHNKIWKPNLGDLGDDSAHGLDHSRMELLQMSALLIRDHQSSLAEARKDVIKFGWNYIKLEDIVNKQAAYVLIAFFIKYFETPSKIVIQIYVALLKAHQHEGRPLVTQALELIAPVLRKRVPSRADDKYPIWARWPRRILSEEGHNQHQMTNIFQFLVRHDDLFYDSREHFSTWIVAALPKLVFQMPNPSTEYKKLFIKLVTLIWKWEQRRVELSRTNQSPESSPSRKRKAGTMLGESQSSPSAQPATPAASEPNAIPTHLRTLVIKYLINFICRIPEKYSGKADEPSTKALQLLKDFLGSDYWGSLEIDLYPQTMEEYLVTNDVIDTNLPGFVNALHVLEVILQHKTDEWVLQQLPQLQTYLDKPMRSDNQEIQQALQPVLVRVLQSLPIEKTEGDDEDDEPKESSDSSFIKLLSNIVQENLNSNLMSSVHILHTLSEKRPSVIDDHILNLMRAFQKLAKDHVSAPAVGQPGMPILANGTKPDAPSGGNTQMFDAETTTRLLCMVMDVAAARISALGDQRRSFLSVMAQLVEKSGSTKLCLKMLSIVEQWVFGETETFPTVKEKTAVLSKMLTFETRPDPELCNRFLELVIKIYEDPVITKTELTVRLEHAFLVGTRAKDVNMRNRFLQIFDKSISRTVSNRFSFVLATQNWEQLHESYWLHQASHLLFGSVDMDCRIELHEDDFRLTPATTLFGTYGTNDKRKGDVMVDDKFEEFMNHHRRFLQGLADVRSGDIFEPVRQLQHLDAKCGHEIWVFLFPLCWSALGREDRQDLSRGMVSLLAKDWHHRCMDKRPNVIQSLLEGVERAKPKLNLPAHEVKFLSRSYDAWYTALRMLEANVNDPPVEANVVRESNLDALTEMYATLGEEDMFYGLWRRRAQYIETNAALSFEQHGMWDKAQQMYENAQIKARTGMLPFSTSEYMLWEDHWVSCAQKLQQWEILNDFAKHENYNDLMLECGWRLIDNWNGQEAERMEQTVKSLMDAPTPRRYFFAAFIALQKVHQKSEAPSEFSRLCDEAIQLSLRKWHSLPSKITNAHIPLLQAFQQLVELHDASVMYQSLNSTTAQNLDTKSQELKMLLGFWRERLPNVWDDINAWHDLVTWRQHIFHSINQTYLPLLPGQGQGAGNNSSYGHRGHHETAWIINRFAHVARKHQLPDVCINQLSKIYTLPNIEIQEAFLKLREQAKCHFQNSSELTQGLEVINNTNLGYFAPAQKAEFYTLKGMFLSKLKQKEEANEAFRLALYHDLKLPKAWAQWGHYSDQVFKDNPTDMSAAANAVSCYLEAAGLFKNGKARKLLGRILWLLSLDDSTAKISESFDNYKGDVPVWYWITYIPQLLTSLSHKEARSARVILIKIAKNYPQALYFLLRTSREDYQTIKKQAAQAASRGKAGSPVISQSQPPNRQGSTQPQPNGADAGKAGSPQIGVVSGVPQQGGSGSPVAANAQINSSSPPPQPQPPIKRLPWEYAEEIMSVLKTAFPLLALSMETVGDQISKFFKCPPDEDAYRLIVALLNDGLQWISRTNPSLEDSKLPPTTEVHITRFAETVLPVHTRVAFEADFVTKKPNLFSYIERLRRWRDRFEEKLDRRRLDQNLESFSPHLSEFRFQKFDDVEVPGQYLLHKDNNKYFVRIDRFLPKVDIVRGHGTCHRRLKMRGHDGSIHSFAVQHPAARHCRREERILQLFRIFNGVLSRKKESRRRNLNFHLPLMIPLAPHLRLVQDDSSYISLQAIFEDHCRQIGINKDDPIVFSITKAIGSLDPGRPGQQTVDPNVKLEIFKAIQEKYVPPTVLLDFLTKSYPSFFEFYLFRRQFSYQFAALTFLTYVMTMNARFPHKMFISRSSGNIWGSELLPALAQTNPVFHNNEAVPFRATPNLQVMMGPIAIEGIFSSAIMVIARCLSEPDFGLEQYLSVFVRDEMVFWFTQQHLSGVGEAQLREKVQLNSDMIIKKTVSLAQPGQGNLPANQTVIDLISKAANPVNLAQLDHLWMPYL